MNRIKIKKFKLKESIDKSIFYITNRPMFTLCYIPDKTKNEIKMYGKLSSCRAYTTDIFRSIILKKRHPDDKHGYYVERHSSVRLNNVLLSIGYNTNIEKILNIIRIINYYNNIGRIPKFKLVGLTNIEGPNKCNKNVSIWILRISMKCKEKPFLMSMSTLLIRILLTLSNKTLKTIKSIDDIEEYFFTHSKPKDNSFDWSDRDSLYKFNNYLKLRLIMENHKKLFYGLGKKTLFPFDIGYKFHNESGINSLCTGITFNDVLNKRSEEMLKVKEVNKN